MRLRAGAATDIGLVRATNQDQLLVAFPLFAVADGMGGHAAGEVASRVAVEALGAAFGELAAPTPEGLGAAARAANRAVWDHAQTEPELRGMGTTLVAIALVEADGSEELAVANVGDSRAYRMHDSALEQITVDHSLVQELVDEGQLAEEEAAYHPQRHVLTRALGVDAAVTVDLMEVSPTPGDRFLLCSDGLVREVGDDQVASILRRFSDPDDSARELVAQAKHNGGNDNITVVVVDVVADEEPTVADDGLVAAKEEEKGTAVVPPSPVRGVRTRWLRRPASPAGSRGDQPSPAGSRGDQPSPADAVGRQSRPAPLSGVLSIRVVAFLVLFVGILALAGAGVGLYARGTYYVGLSGTQLIIFQGRPGGLLWFRPTIAARTSLTTADVLPYQIPVLRAGQEEGSLAGAQAYVRNLATEYSQARGVTTTTGTSAP
ncbi:MAG TPA: Stp1/IreP family PP2C-type Ser/Thr phosphatase [Acidimicrobiales bacterium]|nr:Stp1/IreP family PP2C-type Ser/Thr phosphatase [Acidimicrobiales bacterium]